MSEDAGQNTVGIGDISKATHYVFAIQADDWASINLRLLPDGNLELSKGWGDNQQVLIYTPQEFHALLNMDFED